MGNSNSTLTVNEFKNQIIGAVVLNLIPKLDNVKFTDEYSSEGMIDNSFILPKIQSGDINTAFSTYYGKSTDTDLKIEKYLTDRVLSNPENLKIFNTTLTDALFNIQVVKKFNIFKKKN